MKKMFLLPVLLLAFGAAKAEEGDSAQAPASGAAAAPVVNEELTKLQGQVDGLNESYLETKTTVDKLAKIKVSGYIQAQWQHADSIGQPSAAGGAFAPATDRRFVIRRGRLKTVYETATSKYSLEFEAVPTGVSVKDMSVTLMEPWLKTFDLSLGVMDRPYGFEVSYSSSAMETPERTRFSQTYLNGEKDLGVQLFVHPANMGFLDFLNLKAGLFNGLGGNVNEVDRDLDFIGRLGFKAPFNDLNMEIDGGFSAYRGTVTNVSDTALVMGDTSFVKSAGHRFQEYDRELMGVDAQLYYDIPVIGGTNLKFEYNWGEMPSNVGSNSPYVPNPVAGLFSDAKTVTAANVTANNLQVRKLAAWYLTWVQNLGNHFQTVVRYDVFDPNTEVEGKDIHGGTNNLGAADITWKTLGLGLICHWDANLKFTAYYDIVKNEEVKSGAAGAVAPYAKDLNDNVFTFRAQVKF